MAELSVRAERWPIAGAFTIARGSKTEAEVVVVELADGAACGRGEAVPYKRYGETVEGALAEIEGLRGALEAGCDAGRLQGLIGPGAARNAVDCALWDLEAKRTGVRAWVRAGRPQLHPVTTAYTLSLASPEVMADSARAAAHRPLLKLKIGGAGDLDRVAAVREAAPASALIVDANEALSFDELRRLAPDFARLEVRLIEQPLRAGEDEALEGYASPVPLCADESLHTRAELAACARRYAAINIKLDKTGGLTEALALAASARGLGLSLMAGCMVSTSLAMAPALIIAQDAAFTDLDGPLLLARDREPGLVFEGSRILPPSPALWG
ncbi:MAG: dipeptide epimerase [Caulobacteraceae bacterium]|nr:dipeptide epimerase [Caulobacteraceae bacterium]